MFRPLRPLRPLNSVFEGFMRRTKFDLAWEIYVRSLEAHVDIDPVELMASDDDSPEEKARIQENREMFEAKCESLGEMCFRAAEMFIVAAVHLDSDAFEEVK